MSIRTAMAELSRRLRHPKTTVRARLTFLYGGLFLLSGSVLLVVTYVLAVGVFFPKAPHPGPVTGAHPGPPAFIRQQRASDIRSLLAGSGIALAIMTVVSVAVGWIAAGRVLRPLRTITSTTRQISEENLHQRLALPGPPDELRDLGDTIDGLLERLEVAFEAQRSFVASASHELRTPLTLSRATLQVALSDPSLTLPSLRAACEEAIETGRQQEQLIEALLTLARSQRGLADRDLLDLAAVTRQVTDAHTPAARAAGLRLNISLAPAPLLGDASLVERLLTNLVQNAIRYNLPGGTVTVTVENTQDTSVLTVTNTGPDVPGEQIPRLLQPFQRIAAERISNHSGLGLSIVQAIATAHHAELAIFPGDTGGLDIQVHFQPVTSPRQDRNRRSTA
jgi:signal transduction histidine kinase